jgi:hypothetical protein
VENAALLGTLRMLRTRTLHTLRAPEAEKDAGMRTDVGAVGEPTCCKCIRDAPARLCCISRARFDG